MLSAGRGRLTLVAGDTLTENCRWTEKDPPCAILFQDELTYYSQPDDTLVYGSMGAGSPHLPKAIAANQMSRIGAVMDGLTGQVIYIQGDKFGKLKMEELYRQTRQQYLCGRHLFVVQDNCSFHYSDNVLAAADELNISPVFLPTYSSWLNPIEKLWRWLKADVLHGHTFAHDYLQLRSLTADFLDQFAHGSDRLLRYVGLLPD